jgi:hypothetical protein
VSNSGSDGAIWRALPGQDRDDVMTDEPAQPEKVRRLWDAVMRPRAVLALPPRSRPRGVEDRVAAPVPRPSPALPTLQGSPGPKGWQAAASNRRLPAPRTRPQRKPPGMRSLTERGRVAQNVQWSKIGAAYVNP